jgi:surface polysaccharide O-acyltransferase-like enzyme
MKTRNASIDVFRVVAAIMVVMIHTSGRSPILMQISSGAARISVPFFMMTSAYFFFSRLTVEQEDKQLLRKTLFSILKLWFIWMVIYLPRFFDSIRHGSTAWRIGVTVRGFLGASTNFVGSWYLIATSFGLLATYWFISRGKQRNLYILAVCSYLFTLSMTGFGEWTKLYPVMYKFNKVMMPGISFVSGLSWVTLAYVFAKNENWILTRVRPWMLLPSTCLLYLELFLVTRFEIAFTIGDGRVNTDQMLVLPLVMIVVFSIMIKKKIKLSESITEYLRDIATLIFFLHFGCKWIIGRYVEEGALQFALVLFITFTVANIWRGLSTTQRFSVLSRAY